MAYESERADHFPMKPIQMQVQRINDASVLQNDADLRASSDHTTEHMLGA